jgi:transcriptional regulator with XRE-family HTH domain
MATPPVDDGMRDRLREARRGMGLKQQDVADRLQVSRRSVSEWEGGQRRPHSKLPELAALYGVSTSYLLTGAEPTSVELRELRETVDELYEFVIQLAHKTADDFAAVLQLLGLPPEADRETGEGERPAPATPAETPARRGVRRAHGRAHRARQDGPTRSAPGAP